jgi:hypothetical protein
MRLLALSLMLPAMAAADPVVFDGYEAYYAASANKLFEANTAVELEAYVVQGAQAPRFGWAGAAGGRKHRIEVRRGAMFIDGHALRFKSAHVFAGEVADSGDLGRGSTAYFAPGWACVENTPSSASGTAVRHKSVYLARLGSARLSAWKLPSLFASCTGIRQHAGQIRFDKVEYRYEAGQDDPSGVFFKEYSIRRDNSFIASGSIRAATFAEPGNVYKFSFSGS